jgi:hypothetical protein
MNRQLSKSSSDIGGSNSANTSKELSRMNYGDLPNFDRRNNSIVHENDGNIFELNENPMQNTYYSFKKFKN